MGNNPDDPKKGLADPVSEDDGAPNGEDTSVGEVLNKLSKDKPKEVTEMMAMFGAGPVQNPLHEKLTPEHITQVLELAAKHDKREYILHKSSQKNISDQGKSNRRYAFATFIVALLSFAFVVWLFKDQPSTLIPIITGMGGLVGGFLGGWGFGKSHSG